MTRPWLVLFSFLIGVFIITPDFAFAQCNSNALYAVINCDKLNLLVWQFFRTGINYVIAVMLIVAAFATTFRLNIESYTIKKILPTLIIAFLLANFSHLLMQTALNVTASLSGTIFGISNGEFHIGIIRGNELLKVLNYVERAFSNTFTQWLMPTTGEGLAKFLEGVITANLKVVFALIIAAPLGLVVGLAFGLMALALYLMFLVRFWVVQILVAVSPLAFILMAFPSSQGLFKNWLNALTKWLMVKPVALLFLGFANTIATSPAFENRVFLGTAGIGILLTLAVSMPFRMGGMIMAKTYSWAAKGGSALRLGTAGTLGGVAGALQKGNRAPGLAKALRVAQGTLYAPEAIKQLSTIRRAQIERESTGIARRGITRTGVFGAEAAREAELELTAEYEKTLSSQDLNRALEEAVHSNDPHRLAAVFNAALKKGQLRFILEGIKNKTEFRDALGISQAQANNPVDLFQALERKLGGGEEARSLLKNYQDHLVFNEGQIDYGDILNLVNGRYHYQTDENARAASIASRINNPEFLGKNLSLNRLYILNDEGKITGSTALGRHMISNGMITPGVLTNMGNMNGDEIKKWNANLDQISHDFNISKELLKARFGDGGSHQKFLARLSQTDDQAAPFNNLAQIMERVATAMERREREEARTRPGGEPGVAAPPLTPNIRTAIRPGETISPGGVILPPGASTPQPRFGESTGPESTPPSTS